MLTLALLELDHPRRDRRSSFFHMQFITFKGQDMQKRDALNRFRATTASEPRFCRVEIYLI